MLMQESKKQVIVELCIHTLRNLEYIMMNKTFPDGGISRIPEEVDAVSVAIRDLVAYLQEERELIPEKRSHQKIFRTLSTDDEQTMGTDNIITTKKRTTTKQWRLDEKTYNYLQFLLTLKIIYNDETDAITSAIDRLESIIRYRNPEEIDRVKRIYEEFLLEKQDSITSEKARIN